MIEILILSSLFINTLSLTTYQLIVDILCVKFDFIASNNFDIPRENSSKKFYGILKRKFVIKIYCVFNNCGFLRFDAAISELQVTMSTGELMKLDKGMFENYGLRIPLEQMKGGEDLCGDRTSIDPDTIDARQGGYNHHSIDDILGYRRMQESIKGWFLISFVFLQYFIYLFMASRMLTCILCLRCNMHLMFPLFPGNRKSIPSFLCHKKLFYIYI